METQPPPGAPVPPPSEHAVRSRKRFHVIVWMGVLSIIILLSVIVVAPLVMRSKKAGNFTAALLSARMINAALMEFEKDYGRYPDTTTISEVRTRTGTDMIFGTSTSNEYLRQLLAVEPGANPKFPNERAYSIRGEKGALADYDIQGSRALEKGECGFAYIPGLSSLSPTDMPVLIGPLVPGTDKVDASRADGKAVALCIDGSAIELKVDSAGHVMVRGKRLLDPANPIWDGKPPTLVWPE